MMRSFENLYSIINNKVDAKDKDRAFTFIEFIKEFGFDNSSASFINDYKKYLSSWNNLKQNVQNLSDKEFIRESLIDTLKSIIITYSSYEEQDFLANIDWNNEKHKKAIIPFFAEKIKNICDFYKGKRQETHLIINKNNFKGSKNSLEQIIYDKIIDFYFENKNLKPQIAQLQNELTISIEQYADIYSEYFDIPRHRSCTDESRAAFIEANINNVNYEEYISLAKVVSDLMFNGEIYLEEIPLIAQAALDFSQQCVGDLAILRDNLLNTATINQVPLNEQIFLRRKLYEKYLGCDLYYIYCDDKDNITIDVLTRAENPSGNLLNCGSADTATIESDDIKLISNIGLFFKPDKMGILKINSDNFTWEIDKTKLKDETFYIFPDPNKYGNIGNNKDLEYPLLFEYKLDSIIKNISSGYAKDEPLAWISASTWNTYHTTQDRDYILNDNKDFNYSFTSLANAGILTNYQKDIFGNEFGLLKGIEIKNNNIYVSSSYEFPKIIFEAGTKNEKITNINKKYVLFNGGYFKDPRIKDTKFPHDEFLRISDDYLWTGISLNSGKFSTPQELTTVLNLGSFKNDNEGKYIDHYNDTPSLLTFLENTPISNFVLDNFKSTLSDISEKIIIDNDEKLLDKKGELYIKVSGNEPLNFKSLINNEIVPTDILSFEIYNDILIIKEKDKIYFYQETYDNNISFHCIETIEIDKNVIYNTLYNETYNTLIIALLEQNEIKNNIFDGVNIIIHEFNFDDKKLYKNKINTKLDINENKDTSNFRYVTLHKKLDKFNFTYNKSLKLYLISYLHSSNSLPYIYNHSFKLYNKERFYNTLYSEVFYKNATHENYNHVFYKDDTEATSGDNPFLTLTI